uniref:Alpha-D-phosphohexomutase C-terminal domain-containing protein n=2 Tax=Clastoptera arizonana TaxID=38151 RepID=A0A1B6CV25_9HEMI
MKNFLKYIGDSLQVTIYNSDTATRGKLNFKCGADHIKTMQSPPDGVPLIPFKRCVSVDGDADRIVYYYTDDSNEFYLLDGDRIATLAAGYLMEVVRSAGLQLKMGLVQTAYANGNSTKYITEKLKVPVVCVPTGVKHLHHKALEFDIGVYFEANGHGTVVFSENAKNKIKEYTKDINKSEYFEKLVSIIDMINETVGDAISDLLLVETILHDRKWSIEDWYHTYNDLPSVLVKVSVKDRNLISTTADEQKCVTPPGLQVVIDKLVAEYPNGRAFVRPSGTEDVIRVYAEADTIGHTNELAEKVTKAVYELAGGVGTIPKI